MRSSILSSVRKNPLIWLMAALFVGGLALAWALYLQGAAPNTLEWELAKMSMQVAVVAVAGALLSFVADRYRKREEKDRLREEHLKEMLKRFTSSYNKSKGCRRIARGLILGTGKDESVEVDTYDKIVAELNAAQLELETVKRDLETSGGLFKSDAALEKIARAMEKYLNGIVDEYERERRNAGADAKDGAEAKDGTDPKVRIDPKGGTDPKVGAAQSATLKLSKLERFKSFLDEKDRWAFDQYASLHGDARDLINKELLALTDKAQP